MRESIQAINSLVVKKLQKTETFTETYYNGESIVTKKDLLTRRTSYHLNYVYSKGVIYHLCGIECVHELNSFFLAALCVYHSVPHVWQ
jgi:hypothetical protein